MKYAIWFVRLVFVAWMLPAGLNHFVPLFPQPLGNMPLSRELFAALDTSHLFDLVKAVELLAALCVLTGFYTPLGLLLCMPVSFCVWYWDTALQGWTSFSAIYGWAVLVTNILLCLSYLPSYRAMLAPLAKPRLFAMPESKTLILVIRILFGGWMVLSGANFFFLHLYALPPGSHPWAIELMSALAHSQLLDVAMGIQLVAGALILVGLFVPLALCVIMPVSVCAAYWAVILEHEPIGAALALLAVALNAVLLLGHLESYKGMLRRQPAAVSEGNTPYEKVFVDPRGRTPRGLFIAALIPLALATLFYHFLVFGMTGYWATLVFLFPATVIYTRRLHDMGHTHWLLIAPAIPVAVAIWFHMFNRGTPYDQPSVLVALGVAALLTLWGVLGKGQKGINRYGLPPEARIS